ncbi:hypothetical protein [Idiomarina sp. HP20-50]|uniref:hypothetical protein n=1 Tax=Idiomarina sp. HP20-50 TaxID=3070813 RepID=UPI00294AB4DB|nr:hypothetical protein [Idiomarina sp. HP20-50]MDV6316883.1 hypothetical protein [Idiomarina sp. HP20-50]
MTFKRCFLSALFLVVISGCEQPPAGELVSAEIKNLDEQLLPNENWQLSKASIELSFCRDRINEALMGSERELRGWRLTGESTAFPPYRTEGLNALAKILDETGVLLWQREGNVSAQRYYLVKPASATEGEVADAVFPAVVKLSSLARVCHAAVDDSK